MHTHAHTHLHTLSFTQTLSSSLSVSPPPSQAWGPRPPLQSACPSALPFVTSFCEGRGKGFWLQGRCVSAAPWHNLAALDVQPALLLPALSSLGTGADAGEAAACLCLCSCVCSCVCVRVCAHGVVFDR